MTDKQMLSVRIDSSLIDDLDEIADDRGITRTELIVDIFEQETSSGSNVPSLMSEDGR